MRPVILNWLNENSLTPYPLEKTFGYDGLIIDANFIQFDNFIPVLNSIKFQDKKIAISITFDLLTKIIYLTEEDYNITNLVVTIEEGGRYLGMLKFGNGLTKFVNNSGEQFSLNIGIKFLPHLVKSIPSRSGVYSIDNKYGPFYFLGDNYISFDVNDNDITFNAIYYPPIETELYLKTLNSVGPTNNNVFIKNTDIIKVASEPATVVLSLVGTSQKGLTKANAIIVTSDGG